MKITDKFYSEKVLESVVFYDKVDHRIIMDIDMLFKRTNRSFADLLRTMGLEVSFDFSNRDHKKLYMHEFIKNVCEWIKYNRKGQCGTSWFFFSNVITKDPFRNSVIKKMKSVFGFKIWEEPYEFSDFINKIENNDYVVMPKLEVMFDTDKKPKSLRNVKKNLDKMGLTYLHEIYFNDPQNKRSVIG